MPGPAMGSNDGKGRYLVVSTTYDEKVPGFKRVDSGTPVYSAPRLKQAAFVCDQARVRGMYPRRKGREPRPSGVFGVPVLVSGMGVEIRQQQAHSRIPFVGIVCENRSYVAACLGRCIQREVETSAYCAPGVPDINTGGNITWH